MPGKPLPQFVAPMQASSVKTPFDSPDWIFETKMDGYRAIAVIDSAGKARLWSRNRLPLEPNFDGLDAIDQLNPCFSKKAAYKTKALAVGHMTKIWPPGQRKNEATFVKFGSLSAMKFLPRIGIFWRSCNIFVQRNFLKRAAYSLDRNAGSRKRPRIRKASFANKRLP